MKKKLLILKINLIAIYLLTASFGYAQCPNYVNIIASTKCILLGWDTPPITFPASITYNTVVYNDVSSGAGTLGDPRVYRDATAGNANCSGNQNPITGIINIPGACSFLSGVLPLKLLSFEGQKVNNINYLKWTTSLEQNTDLFEVESSLNGQKFEKIGTVKTINDNSEEISTYSFTDATISEQPIYYRLKTIDVDGTINNSKIIAVTGSENLNNINAFPSPTSGIVNINVLNESNIGTTARVLDLTGKQLISFPVSKKIMPLDLSNLNKGLYIIRFNNGEFVKVIKQ